MPIGTQLTAGQRTSTHTYTTLHNTRSKQMKQHNMLKLLTLTQTVCVSIGLLTFGPTPVQADPTNPNSVVTLRGTSLDYLETALNKQEVQKWLADYEQAWAAKDIKQLMQIGEYSSETAAQANQVLAQYLEYRVELTNVDIQIDKNQAVIHTQRIDTITSEQRGLLGRRSQHTESHAHPGVTTFVLKKEAGKIKRAR